MSNTALSLLKTACIERYSFTIGLDMLREAMEEQFRNREIERPRTERPTAMKLSHGGVDGVRPDDKFHPFIIVEVFDFDFEVQLFSQKHKIQYSKQGFLMAFKNAR